MIISLCPMLVLRAVSEIFHNPTMTQRDINHFFSDNLFEEHMIVFNPLQHRPFHSCSWGVTYILRWWNLAVIPYLKKIQRIYKWHDKPLEFCCHQHFFTQNHKLLLYQEIDIYVACFYMISNYFSFFLVFKSCFIKTSCVLDDGNKIYFSRSFFLK